MAHETLKVLVINSASQQVCWQCRTVQLSARWKLQICDFRLVSAHEHTECPSATLVPEQLCVFV
jgi:hypothetical protein